MFLQGLRAFNWLVGKYVEPMEGFQKPWYEPDLAARAKIFRWTANSEV